MPSVVTLSTCVSPRWNRPEPWAVGSTPTSDDSGRMSVGVRPSMRAPSLTMRRRTIFFSSALAALLISRCCSGNSGSSVSMTALAASPWAASRSALTVMPATLVKLSVPMASTRAEISSV